MSTGSRNRGVVVGFPLCTIFACALFACSSAPGPAQVQVAISISPASATLAEGATQQFAASVTNAADTDVTWSLAPGGSGGTISGGGLYTAPGQSGSDVVIATSLADATKTARATVTVTSTPAVTAPALGYSPSSLVCTRGVACSLAAPKNSGGPMTSLWIAPVLPAGLAFDASMGSIAGTPTALAARASYTVTAANAGGTATAIVSIEVDDAAPSALAYSASSLDCVRGVACALGAPTSSGGAVTNFSIAPALPTGLAIDASSGAIAGTATTASTAQSFTVTGSNTGGSATAQLSIAVTVPAPTQLIYSPAALACTVGVACSLGAPSTMGTASGFAISPALPSGLAIDASTGAIAGTPSAPSASAVYAVTAANGADSAQGSVTIAVNEAAPAAPSGLAYSPSAIDCAAGAACSSGAPAISGGVPTFSIQPALPAGLALDASTGLISGTPAATLPPSAFTITASNASGSTTAALTLNIVLSQSAWVGVGPAGGAISSLGGGVPQLVFDPSDASRAYLLDSQLRVFGSADRGASWSYAMYGLEGGPGFPDQLAVGADGSLYAAMSTGPQFSRDHGATWLASAMTTEIDRVAADAVDASLVYAAEIDVVPNTQSLYVSTDQGATWSVATTPPFVAPNVPLDFELLADPFTTRTIYAFTGDLLFKSIDAAATWTRIDAGLPISDGELSNLAADPSVPGKLYVASATKSLLYVSTDGGVTWSAGTSFGLASANPPAQLFAGPGGAVYVSDSAGLAASTDSGQTFTAQSLNPADSILLAVSPSSGDEFVGDANGVYVRRAATSIFTADNAGLFSSDVPSIATDASGDLFAATGAGLYVTSNQGASWQQLDTSPVAQVLVDPQNGALFELANGLLRTSTDRGATWQNGAQIAGPLLFSNGVLWALSQGFAQSTDDGATFTQLAGWPTDGSGSAAVIHSFAIDPSANAATAPMVAIGGQSFADDGGYLSIFHSADGGRTWALSSGAPASGSSCDLVAADPQHAGTFQVACPDALYVSTDGGATFSPSGLPGSFGATNRENIFFAIAPTSDHTFYLGTGPDERYKGGLWTSVDQGQSWTETTLGFTSTVLTNIAFQGSEVFVSTNGGGVLEPWSAAQ